MRVPPVLVLSLAFSAAPSWAQDLEGVPDSGFWVTEVGYGHDFGEGAHYASLEYGPMWPVAERIALGFAGHLGISDQQFYGVKPRLRAFVSDGVSVDLGAGVLFGGDRPAISGHLGVGLGGTLILTGQLDKRTLLYFDDDYRSHYEFFLGAKLDGKAGVIGSIIGGVGGAALLLLLFATVEN
jgi:hypothetical protein